MSFSLGPRHLILFLISVIQLPLFVQASAWWNSFPKCAQPYLDLAVPESCDRLGMWAVQVECLCGSEGFRKAAGKGIGAHCGCVDLYTSANILSFECMKNHYDLTKTEMGRFLAAGQPCSQNTTTSAPTSGSTAPAKSGGSNPSGDKHGSGGLSTAEVVVIAVLASVVTILTGMFILWNYYRKGKKKQVAEAEKAVSDDDSSSVG